MSPQEFGMIVVGGLIGWWLVSWIIDKLRASTRENDGHEGGS
jgi:hypothetical protein